MADVVDKVRKLLTLARNAGATPAEAAAAASAAQALADKHRLEIGAIADEEQIFEDPEALWRGGRGLSFWRAYLAENIALLNGCAAVGDRTSGRTSIHLIGRATDIAIARYIYVYLERAIDRLGREAARGRGRTWGTTFRIAAVQEVLRRLRLAREGDITAAPKPGALVCLDERAAAVRRWAQDNYPDKYKSGRRRYDREAHIAGKNAARDIPLRTALAEPSAEPAPRDPELLGSEQ